MEPAKETRKQGSPLEIHPNRDADLAGLRILIVEDMGMIAMELRMLLDSKGCRVVGVASRLHEAIKLAQTTENLDGVLLDLNLSGECSYPVAEILHQRGIPFIIMSGYDNCNIRADCANDAHVQKPFTHDELLALIRRTFRPQ